MAINYGLIDQDAPRRLADIFNPESIRMRQAKLQGAEQDVTGQELVNVERARSMKALEQARQEKERLAPQVKAEAQQKKMAEYSKQIDFDIANDLKAGLPRDVIKQRAAAKSKQFGFTDEQISGGLKELDLIQDNEKVYNHYLFAADPEAARKEQIKQELAPEKKVDEGRPVQIMKAGKPVMVMSGSGRVIGEAPVKAGRTAGPAQLSATAQKELFEAEDVAQSSQNVIASLDEALSINDKAYSGYGAKARAIARSNIPGESEAANATIALDNIMTSQALESLKAVFGGMPTEGERKILLDMQASADKTPAQRKDIINRAKQAAARRMKVNQEKAAKLRSGEYFAPQTQSDEGWEDI